MKKLAILIILLFEQVFGYYSFNTEFFSRFNDCYLEQYVKQALYNNHSLKEANYRVDQYRSEVKKSFSKELPSLSVASNYLGTHFPKGDSNFFIRENSFILPFSVAYEPDLLLKTKDKINSTKYLYKASVANKKWTYISLLSDLVSTYVNILLYDFLIKQQEEILSAKEKNLSYTFNKFNFGVVDLINLNNSKEELNAQKTVYQNLIKNRNQTLYNFSVLIGESAYNSDEIERGKLEDFEYQGIIPDCISSDIIYQRPDLIEAQDKLKSAKIDITVARKDFFPTFNIRGSLVFDTAGRGNFFSWNSSFAYLLLGATQDIFKGGEKIANLKIKKARYQELLENYKQKDLVAIKEINNALNIIKQDTKTQEFQLNQLELEKKNLNAQGKKLKRGTISKIEYLNDKNSYHQQEQLFAASKALRLVDYFTLYKAVGGEL